VTTWFFFGSLSTSSFFNSEKSSALFSSVSSTLKEKSSLFKDKFTQLMKQNSTSAEEKHVSPNDKGRPYRGVSLFSLDNTSEGEKLLLLV